jgi:hypothetical protein
MIYTIICSFLYLHKETNQRKCSRSLGSLSANCPAQLKNIGRCETRPPKADSDSPRADPIFFSLLGCVKWHLQNR